MKLSNIFTKTSKDSPGGEISNNAKLLIKAGFIDKTMAGVYAFLPLGLRVLNKIENIIRQEMQAIGSQEILMNALNPKSLWTDTGRWENVSILFKLKSQTENEYALACSHEEQVTPLVKKFVNSFKDLPIFNPTIQKFENPDPSLPTQAPRQTVHLIVHNPKTDKYLVIDNSKTHSASNHDFYPIGGSIEAGETFFDTLIRELFEESGITSEEILDIRYLGELKQIFPVIAFGNKPAVNKHLVSQIFYVTVDSEKENFVESLKSAENEITVWKKLDEINDMLAGFKHCFKKRREIEKNLKYPLSVFQIQTKFRDELRAKSGLLRGIEFRMKDMYDFHQNQESLDKYYELVKYAYSKCYHRMGIKAHATEASGGIFTTNPSHEFQAICNAGEDKIYEVPSRNKFFNEEIAPVKAPEFDNTSESQKPLQEVEGKGIIGVETLAKFLQIPIELTTKTILFEDEHGGIIAAAVRGDYNISEEKLAKITKTRLKLASAHLVKKVTGAEIGYAGLLNLPPEVKIFMDDSMQNRVNFEMGANKTNYHSINVNFGRDLPEPETFYDFKTVKEGDLYPETNEKYKVHISAEIGNIFKLGTKYTDCVDFNYTNKQNQNNRVVMGCHGIGSTRCMATIAETWSDDKGLVWPQSVSPFLLHLITHLNPKDSAEINDKVLKIAEKIYYSGFELKVKKPQFIPSNEVLWDDRNLSIGEKLKDADLIGCPWQVVVSRRSLEKGGLELKNRQSQLTEIIEYDI